MEENREWRAHEGEGGEKGEYIEGGDNNASSPIMRHRDKGR